MKPFLKAFAALLLVGGTTVACDSYKDNETPDTFVEADKDLNGSWQLSVVKRNGVDITKSMDFSKFRLILNADGTYRLQNRLPFPVKHDGVWRVDDPAHPYGLIFTEDNTVGDVDVTINVSTFEGVRQLSVVHSPGCESNKYEYLFVKSK